MNKFQDVLVVIRSAGERTETLCRKLILEQGVPAEQIVIVKEIPFSATLRKSFELGIQNKIKWTFCIDADVLLRQGSIVTMLSFAEKQDEKVCEIQGFVMDKFFGGPRPAGNHLYRTSLLKKAIDLIPVEGVDIRPESYLLNKLMRIGHPYVSVDYVVGIHDNYQYYRDIFRKCWVQAIKHGDRFNLFMKIWKEQAKHDYDFQVALKGFAAGVISTQEVFINKNLEIFNLEFQKAEIIEKGPMGKNEVTLDTIEDKIVNWKYDEFYLKMFPDLNSISSTPLKIKLNYKEKLDSIRNRGIAAYYTYRLGSLFKKMGTKIQSVVE
jgi:hypothetical protein